MPSRQEMWNRLGDEVDVIIIGGGITGAGIARDAARRGLKVALIEKNDLAYGTSSRSSKLIHGGMRYLESYEFSLVFESVSERRLLMDLAPHLVNPQAFLFPVYRGDRRNLWTINAGMLLYDGLSLFRSPKKRKSLKPAEVREVEPAVKQDGLSGAPLYYDCSTDDARLTLENALDAANHDAAVVTWARADAFMKDDHGRVCGVVVKDCLSGELKEVRAPAVVNATGPWTDETLGMSGPRKTKVLRLTKGIHIVVDWEKLPVNHAVVLFHPDDDRVLFALPWGNRTYVGTTDTDYEGSLDDIAATLWDVDYLIAAANAYFPEHQIARDDVLATWSGLRPLIAPDTDLEEVSESKVSREHQIMVGQDGLITIAGGKLTTFRKMAEEVVETVVQLLRLSDGLPAELKPSESDKAPLPGAVGWPEDDDHAKVAAQTVEAGEGKVEPHIARYLSDSYGMFALNIARLCAEKPELLETLVDGQPDILAQVEWAVNNELAASVSDIMIRRTQLFYRDANQGLGVIEKVAGHMTTLLGWSEEQKQRSIDEYKAEVALSRKWREEL